MCGFLIEENIIITVTDKDTKIYQVSTVNTFSNVGWVMVLSHAHICMLCCCNISCNYILYKTCLYSKWCGTGEAFSLVMHMENFKGAQFPKKKFNP